MGAIIRRPCCFTIVRHNRFGVLPSGEDAETGLMAGLSVGPGEGYVADNEFARAEIGMVVKGPPPASGGPTVVRNTFRRCEVGVLLHEEGSCLLGDLGNGTMWDDGGNRFRLTNTWHIRNETPNYIKAEGNEFGTTGRAEIADRTWDGRDDPALGRIDFLPLVGGTLPTGVALAVTGATAMPMGGGGAEISFSLSPPAAVTAEVLNIAGRPVTVVMRDRELGAGVQRLVWSGRKTQGTLAPTGVYLVRVSATDEDGAQATALTSLRLQR